jgi:hypothetical protein
MDQGIPENRIIFDGLDLMTGKPRIPALSPIEAGRRILRRWQPDVWRPMSRPQAFGTTSEDWGVVCRSDLGPDIRESIESLVERRGGQVYPYDGELSAIAWFRNLANKKCSLPASSMYLLLVGSPEQIPYDFEKMLTPQHAVGRLHLPDAAAYDRYVRTLLAYEDDTQSTNVRRRDIEFYAPDDTPETYSSCMEFARPLMQAIGDIGEQGFQTRGWLGDEATRERVVTRLGEYRQEGAPALTFFVSHGAEAFSELRAEFQGSWIPQGVPALGHAPSADELRKSCLTGDTFVSGELSPHGSIVFNFSCFGAGLHQEFTLRQWIMEDEIVPDDPHPLVSALGQGLLGNPHPALAYVSTLDRKSNVFSLLPNGLQPFEAWASILLRGGTVGQACQVFWDQSATLQQGASQLLEEALQSGQTAETLPDEEAWDLALNWIMGYELDNFVIQGDPAVRLHEL